jgi:hypothetical protein
VRDKGDGLYLRPVAHSVLARYPRRWKFFQRSSYRSQSMCSPSTLTRPSEAAPCWCSEAHIWNTEPVLATTTAASPLPSPPRSLTGATPPPWAGIVSDRRAKGRGEIVGKTTPDCRNDLINHRLFLRDNDLTCLDDRRHDTLALLGSTLEVHCLRAVLGPVFLSPQFGVSPWHRDWLADEMPPSSCSTLPWTKLTSMTS